MKKRILGLISLALICAMLCSLFVACNGDDDDAEKDNGEKNSGDVSDIGSESESGASLELDTTKFNIFFDTDYVCLFVLPKNATAIEKKVATLLKTSVQKKTGKNITILYEGDEAVDDTKNLILVGNTSFTESKNAAKKLADRSAAIKISNNKMVIVFNNESSGLKIVQKLMTQLNKCDKKAVNIKPTWTAKYTSLPEKNAFIEYTGGKVETTDYENGTVLYTSYGNTLNAFNDYCDSLASAGFESVDNRTQNGHSFRSFIGEEEYIYVYYVKSSHTKDYTLNGTSYKHTTNNVSGVVKIARGPIEQFAESDMTSNMKATHTPKLANVSNPMGSTTDVGQGYVFLLPDGRFIVQDSGLTSMTTKDYVYEAIETIAPDKDNIVIAAWFISHPHGDHVGGYYDFISRYSANKKVTVERVIHNFTKAELNDLIRYDCGFTNGAPTEEKCSYIVEDFYKKTAKYLPDAQLIAAHTGQIFDFGNGANVEVLFTVEDIVPDELENVNNASMVIRVTLGGQKILILADTAHKSNPMIKTMWGSYLKSDIVQMAHHSCWTPDDGIYEDIGAKIVLCTSSYSAMKANFAHSGYKDIVQKVFNMASDVYVADYTVRVLELPYTVQNNKSAEKAKIDSAKS